MSTTRKLKLFISYTHFNEAQRDELITHIKPLSDKGLIEIWYDGKILVGDYLQDELDHNLSETDIFCLLVSPQYLASPACMREVEAAFKSRINRRAHIVPVILSTCAWQDDERISLLLVGPKDGVPIDNQSNRNGAWHYIYTMLKRVIDDLLVIRELVFTKEHADFLQDTDLLSKAHSHLERLLLDDIYIEQSFHKYDYTTDAYCKVQAVELFHDTLNNPKILIAGTNQSGKTALCKRLINQLRNLNFLPVYISFSTSGSHGLMDNMVERAFKNQYSNSEFDDRIKRHIVPIVDDFHYSSKHDRFINSLEKYCKHVIIVDDIFLLDIKADESTSMYLRFKIMELRPTQRYELIEKWSYLDEHAGLIPKDNRWYSDLDKRLELVNSALGKIIGNGIMPAHPFFILSVLSAHETLNQPLDQNITSQGHCYQALIFIYLRKNGVKMDEIDIYLNFLSVISYHIFHRDLKSLTPSGLDEFFATYTDKYALPVSRETLMTNLRRSRLFCEDNLGNYSFCYPYIFYFFVSRYIADHYDDTEDVVARLVKNLHKDANAYITVFILHHTKEARLLDELISQAALLFSQHQSTTLQSEELKFFDEKVTEIAKAVLPADGSTPDVERKRRLELADANEESREQDEELIEGDDVDPTREFALELRRSIKTVEVMGRILKNRVGSLEQTRLCQVFKEALSVHLRLLSLFFEIIRDEDGQNEIVQIISDVLQKIEAAKRQEDIKDNKKPRPMSPEALEAFAKRVFWNLNFMIVFDYLHKAIRSLGSTLLRDIVTSVCDEINSPASFLVKHGIYMWYDKNLQVDAITSRLNDDDFSRTARKVLEYMIVEHAAVHKIDFKDKQRIGSAFNISVQKLLVQEIRK